MEAKDLQIITDSIPAFIATLKSQGFSKISLADCQQMLSSLADFLKQETSVPSRDFIDKYVLWKIEQRAKKKYSYSHKAKQRSYINRFMRFYFGAAKPLRYNRTKMEEQIPFFIGEFKGRYKRQPIEARNGLLSFFDFLDARKFKYFKRGQEKTIDQDIIKAFLRCAESGFYSNRKQYCKDYSQVIKSHMVKYHNFLIANKAQSFWIPEPEKPERLVYFSGPIATYLGYLKNSCSLGKSSLDSNERELKRFDWFLQEQCVKKLGAVKITHIDKYVRERCPSSDLKSIHRVNFYLRKFFKFLYVSDQISNDIAKYIIAAPIYRLSDVPKHLNDDEITAVLSFPNKPRSKQDLKKKAILSLMMFNGLRVGEVAKLTLDDIAWEKKTLAITGRKNRVPLISVMSDYVQASLMEYIAKARPNHRSERQVFFTGFAPIRPMSSRAITQLMRRRLRKHSINCGGAHRMRHTFGTYLLESGNSLKESQLLLGHRSAKSSQIYAKSSMARMREYVVSDEVSV